jgi:hypothetical protein
MNLLKQQIETAQQQIETGVEKNPEIEILKTQIFTLKQFGNFSEIDTREKLQEYVKKCLEIQRPQESPKVFVCSNESDFKTRPNSPEFTEKSEATPQGSSKS